MCIYIFFISLFSPYFHVGRGGRGNSGMIMVADKAEGPLRSLSISGISYSDHFVSLVT